MNMAHTVRPFHMNVGDSVDTTAPAAVVLCLQIARNLAGKLESSPPFMLYTDFGINDDISRSLIPSRLFNMPGNECF